MMADMSEDKLKELINAAVAAAFDSHKEEVVARAAEKVEQRFFENVGRHVATRILKWIGVATVATAVYLYGHGIIAP